MQVNLKRAWFGPDAAFYETTGNPHQFPQDWKGKLPSDAEVLADEVAPAPAKAAKKVEE